MEPERSASRREAPLLAAVALLAFIVFAPALTSDFVHDDHRQIVGNPMVQNLSHLPALFVTSVWAGAGSSSSWYRPLMMSSFALDRAVFGPGPLGFHIVELALYALVAMLVVHTMLAFGAPLPVVLLAGALGVVHPAQAEVAAWISARGDLLCAAGGLAALLLYDSALGAPSRRRRAWFAAAGVAFFAALCGKESAVALAPLFVCVDRVRSADFSLRAVARRQTPWLLAFGVYAALRAWSLDGVSGGILAPMDPLLVLGAFGQGAARIFAPLALTIAPPPPAPWHVLFGILVAIALGVGGALAWQRRSALLLPIALIATLLGIAALGAARIGEIADRYLVLPIFATAWLVAAGVERLPGALRIAGRAAGAAAVAVLAFAAATHVRVYANDEQLWTDAWAKNPRSVRAAANLGALHLDRDEPYRAVEWLERAAALAPGDPEIEMNRAIAMDRQGNARAARQRLEALLAAHPWYWPAAVRAGHLALAAQDWGAAGDHYEAALRVNPLAAEAWAGLGVAREKQGRRDDARSALARALVLDPHVQNADQLRRMLAALDS